VASNFKFYIEEKLNRTFLQRLNLFWFYPLFIMTIPFQYLIQGKIGMSSQNQLFYRIYEQIKSARRGEVAYKSIIGLLPKDLTSYSMFCHEYDVWVSYDSFKDNSTLATLLSICLDIVENKE